MGTHMAMKGIGTLSLPKPGQKPGWYFVTVPKDVGLYYKSLSKIHWNECLNGPHISFTSGEKENRIVTNEEIFPFLGNVEFEYDWPMFTNGRSFWMKVVCPRLDQIRQILGLPPHPIGFHLTLGNVKGILNPFNPS